MLGFVAPDCVAFSYTVDLIDPTAAPNQLYCVLCICKQVYQNQTSHNSEYTIKAKYAQKMNLVTTYPDNFQDVYNQMID